ncbi:hypothetical protein [Azospirillum largimobile]
MRRRSSDPDERGRTSRTEAGDAWNPAAAPGSCRSPAGCGIRRGFGQRRYGGPLRIRRRRAGLRPAAVRTSGDAIRTRDNVIRARDNVAGARSRTRAAFRRSTMVNSSHLRGTACGRGVPTGIAAGQTWCESAGSDGTTAQPGSVGERRRALPCSILFLASHPGTWVPVADATLFLVTDR